jgi:hypothetical protein
LLYTVNERFAGRTGSDLFKMTNKSSRALKRLGDVCDSEDKLGAFVDDLYFLVYEGSGNCKRLSEPPPAFVVDVKFLRTQLRHDLDHGGETDTVKKRRRGGEVLRRYLGVPSLKEASVEQLRTAQLRLLNGLRRLMKNLLHGAPRTA